MSAPLEKLTRRLVKGEVIIRGGSQVFRFGVCIGCDHLSLHNFHRCSGRIRRRIVTNDQFEIFEGLGKDRVQRLGKIVFTIEDGQAEGNDRF